MNMVRCKFWTACLAAGISFLFASCDKTPGNSVKPEETKEYAIFVTVGNEATGGENFYTLTTDNLMKDTVLSPVNSGVEPDNINFWSAIYSAFYKGDFYYTVEGNVISKQRIVDGRYKEMGNIVVESGWQLGMMKTLFNDNGLNFLSWEAKYNEAENVIEKNLYIVDTATMSVKSKNPIKFPPPSYKIYDEEGKEILLKDLQFTPSSFTVRDGKAFVGFYYHWLTKIDTAYMLVCDYPSLENVKLLKDNRLGHVSGNWYASSSSFTDENGDYYFTTSNSSNKYGLLRIKKGETEIDASYAYDMSALNVAGSDEWGYASGDHHAYLKNGIAFVGSYVIDVRNKKVVADLNSYGLGTVQTAMDTYTENNNDLFVILKTSDARWFVGKYDLAANSFTRGTEIHGGVQTVTRLGRLK